MNSISPGARDGERLDALGSPGGEREAMDPALEQRINKAPGRRGAAAASRRRSVVAEIRGVLAAAFKSRS